MRPVSKGNAPRDANGDEIFYDGDNGHRDAKNELHRRLGRYCSYCERTGDLHVEHVLPKKKHPAVANLWVNYLLGCKNCNGKKLEKDPTVADWDALFPDEVNTGWAFVYGPDALVQVNPDLVAHSTVDGQRAQKTIDMVGLDCNPPNDPQDRDLRWQDRDSAWQQAMDALTDVANEDSITLRKRITNEAKNTGFFSVWWTVFSMDVDLVRRSDMRNRFISAFGVRHECYNSDGSVKATLTP